MTVCIEKIYEYIQNRPDPDIILLKKKEVVMWLFGDVSFLVEGKPLYKTEYKMLEDTWGRNVLKDRRPDLRLDKQWTNKFGEHLCEELFLLTGKQCRKPVKRNGCQPDCEVDDAIIEVKTQTFFTDGTAAEKILGCPFKYADIPEWYHKPLKILCLGGAEKLCREHYGNLDGAKCTPRKRMFLDVFKQHDIEFIGATDILKSLPCCC